jgi:hypothetical protein
MINAVFHLHGPAFKDKTLFWVCVRAALDNGFPVNAWGYRVNRREVEGRVTLLHLAIWNDSVENVRMLLAAGAEFTKCHFYLLAHDATVEMLHFLKLQDKAVSDMLTTNIDFLKDACAYPNHDPSLQKKQKLAWLLLQTTPDVLERVKVKVYTPWALEILRDAQQWLRRWSSPRAAWMCACVV